MSTPKDRKNRREKSLHRSSGDDKKKVKSWRNADKKKIKEDTKEAMEELVEYSEEEQDIIKQNLKTINENS
jgi:hypothetical protein